MDIVIITNHPESGPGEHRIFNQEGEPWTEEQAKLWLAGQTDPGEFVSVHSEQR